MKVLKQFSFSPVPVLITLVVFSILMRLGFWQLQRAEEKQVWITQFEQQNVLVEPAFATKLLEKDWSALNGTQVALSGQLKSGQVWLLDNQVYQGKVGYSVVVPFKPESSANWIWLNVGWVTAGKFREQLPQINLPDFLELNGVVKSSEFSQLVLKQEGFADTWPKRAQAITQLMEYDPEVLPLVVFANSGTFLDWPQIYKPSVMPPEKHRAYALQWFLLGLFSLVVFAFASRVKPKSSSSFAGGNNNES